MISWFVLTLELLARLQNMWQCICSDWKTLENQSTNLQALNFGLEGILSKHFFVQKKSSTLFWRSHSAWYKYAPEPFNWSALKLWGAVVLHEVLSKKNVFCAWICFLFHEKWQNIARNIVFFFLIFLWTRPKLCKGLVWQNFKENTPEGEPSFSALSLALRSSHIFYRFLASTTFVETEICTFYLIWGLMWAIL